MKYSIDEIDEMRDLIHQYVNRQWCTTDMNVVEARLRTLMMNGTSVEELREYSKKKVAEHNALWGIKTS